MALPLSPFPGAYITHVNKLRGNELLKNKKRKDGFVWVDTYGQICEQFIPDFATDIVMMELNRFLTMLFYYRDDLGSLHSPLSILKKYLVRFYFLIIWFN